MASQSYAGSCHCQAVTFQVELDLSGAVQCNCSICSKIGAVWAFAPKAKFELRSGAAALKDYQFGKKKLLHRHCARCGVETFAEGKTPDGTPTVGINLRCVDGLEMDKLTPRPFDGRSV